MNALPSGWEVVAIGDVTFSRVPQGAPESKSTFTYVDISSVDNAAKRIVGTRQIQGKDAPSRARQHLAPNDVLVSMTRPNLNAVAKVPSELDKAIGSTGFDVLRCQETEPDWIFYTVRSPAFVQAMSDLVQGALYPAIRSEDIRSYQIPLPPINEQRRIVAKLDAVFDKSRSIREKLDRLPRLLGNLQKSILNAAFRGDLTKEWRAANPNVEPASELLNRIRAERRAKWEADLIAKGKDPKKAKYVEPEQVNAEGLPELPAGWCWAPNAILSDDQPGSICAGPFGTIFKAKDFRTSGIPIVFLRHVGEGKFLSHKPGFMDQEVWKELHQPYSVFGGELLVTKLGDPPGTACIYPHDGGVAMVTPDVMKMSVNGDIAEAQYLMHFFNSPISKGVLRELAFGVTRLRIDLAMFKNFPIPLAPREEQNVILHRINELFAKSEKISVNLGVLGERLNTTISSVLAKAFRGELVPQDPNDEPAAALLERIRASKPQPTKRTRRGSQSA